MASRDLPVVQRILDGLKRRYPNINRAQVMHYLLQARSRVFSGKLMGQKVKDLVEIIHQLIQDDLQGVAMASRDLPVVQRILDGLKRRYPNINRAQVMHYLLQARSRVFSGKLMGQKVKDLVEIIHQLIQDDLQGLHTPCQETGQSVALDWEPLHEWAEFRADVHSL